MRGRAAGGRFIPLREVLPGIGPWGFRHLKKTHEALYQTGRKHGITFEEGATALHDESGRIIPDPVPSDQEDRFLLLGMSWSLRLLVVCHCYREARNLIRIIWLARQTVASAVNMEHDSMRKHYDFSEGRKNPYSTCVTAQRGTSD